MPLREDLAALPAWGFAFPGDLRDELTALALAGTKTTTTGLLAEMEAEEEALPVIANCSSNTLRPRDPFCDATTQGTILAVTTDGGATWTRITH